MNKVDSDEKYWTICLACQGQGRTWGTLSKKARRGYKVALAEFEKAGEQATPPVRSSGQLEVTGRAAGQDLVLLVFLRA